MRFAWVHRDIHNSSQLSFARNITEYATVELLAKGHTVDYCYSIEEAENYDMYAYIGTLYKDEIYNNNVKNINESQYVMFTYDNLIEKVSFINLLLNPQKHFVGNTENLGNFVEYSEKKYDVVVCTSGGVTPLKIPALFNLSDDATIVVADHSIISLDMCEKIVNEWDMVEDLNQFVNKHKVIDDSRLYLGQHNYFGELKKHTNYQFIYVDLFDSESVQQCLNQIEGTNGIWLASNIFNYITTSMLYDVHARHAIQQKFVNLLANDKISWDVGFNTAASGIYKNEPVKKLVSLTMYEGLAVLPWF